MFLRRQVWFGRRPCDCRFACTWMKAKEMDRRVEGTSSSKGAHQLKRLVQSTRGPVLGRASCFDT